MKNSKNIYDLLNEMDFDIEDYKKEELNDIEKKKIKNNFNKSQKRKFHLKRIGSIAVALLLTVGIISQTDLGKSVYAIAESKISKISYSIGKALHIERDIQPYSNVINQTVEENGIEVKLTEVIIDQDELLFSTIISTNIPSDGISLGYEIFINGEKLISNYSGGSNINIDDSGTRFIKTLSVEAKDISIKESVDIKIILKDLKYYYIKDDLNNSREEKTKGKWEFEFTANGKDLTAESYSLPINYVFNIGKQKYKLNEFRYNPVNQKIYGTMQEDCKESYAVGLIGYDNLGNEVRFKIQGENNGEIVLSYSNLNRDLSDDATSITLVPYGFEITEKEGSWNKNAKPIGEEFTIFLKNNR
ncbi:DUF4179 domain-containing protein [Gudongella sp. SC589]|uniref:DUF4179 domain-containing protein n=1 Tax=Gudongella sp. SC589 TaxID=3385990 RepID=UPI0039049B8F